MAVTTKKLFPATSNATTTVFSPVGIQLNNQDDLDVYVTLSGGTRVLQLRQATTSTAQSSHPQVNNTDGLYFPAVTAGTNLINYTLSTDNNTITFNSALPQGAVVFCERRTRDADSSYTTFASGSTIRATDLNNSSTESNFTAQDARNKALTIEGVLFRGDQASTNFVTTDHIVNGTIVEADIANSAVTQNKLANNSVGTPELINGSVTTDKLADDNVTLAKLGGGALPTDITVASANIVNGTITTADIGGDQITNALIADNQIDSEHYVDGSIDHVHLANDIIDGDNIQDDVINSEHIAAGALDNEHYAAGSITSDKLNGATVVTNSEQASHSVNDTSFFTTAAAEARYFNASTGETIKDGQAFPDNDTTIATTAAINDRIIDLVDDVGGFVPIANETSFPTANPDVNNGSGTLVSIQSISSTRTPNSGTVTIANGAGSGNTVSITGCGSTVLSAGFGVIVETTSTLHTYAFHRLVPKATEVTTVAGISSNVTTVATNIADINTVAADLNESTSEIDTVATNIANVNTVGNAIANVNTTAGSIANVNTTAGSITNVNNVGNNISNVNSVAGNESNINSAVSNASNINSAVSNASNINTVAGSISNVNTTAGSISNVNTVASNINSVNSFFNTYRIGANNPTTSLDTGDLFFNTTSNSLKVYTGSAWVDGVTATGNFAVVTGNTFTGSNNHNDNVKSIYGTGSDLEIFHDGSNSFIKDTGTGILAINSNEIQINNAANTEVIIKGVENGAASLYYDGALKLNTKSDGVLVSGELQATNLEATGSSSFNGDVFFLGASSKTITFDQSEGNIRYLDNAKAQFGTQGDFEIFHNGSHAHLIDNGDGNIRIQTNGGGIELQQTNGENLAKFVTDGQCELYHNNGIKIATTSSGVSVTGNIAVSGNVDGVDIAALSTSNAAKMPLAGGTFTGDVTFDGETAGRDIIFDRSDNSLGFADNTKIRIGNSQDLEIYHDGSNSYIDNHQGDLYLRGDSDNIAIQPVDGENAILCDPNEAVRLYYDNSQKLLTTSTGIQVTGVLRTNSGGGNIDIGSHLDLGDNQKLRLGASDDLELYHDGSHSNIVDTGTGNLRIFGNSQIFFGRSVGGEAYATMNSDDSVNLYYDNSIKFSTTSTGVTTTGTMFFDGGSDGSIYIRGAGSDIRFSNGSWTGNTTNAKIQQYNNYLYIFGGSSGIIFRENGTDRYSINPDGHFVPMADGTYDIGTNGTRVRNGYFDTLYGDGSNLTGISSVGGSTGVDFNDNVKARFGSGNDLAIYHNGTDSYIEDVGTGNLKLRTNGDTVQIHQTNAEKMGRFNSNGSVQLYYDNAEKFSTTSNGVEVQGRLAYNSNNYIECNTSANTMEFIIGGGQIGEFNSSTFTFLDDKQARFGNGNDLRIYHQSSDGNNYIDSRNGLLYLKQNNQNKAIVEGGAFSPGNENIDLGKSNLRWQNVHAKRYHGDGVLQARVAYETISTYSIYDSYGVSSLGDNGTGLSDVNFTTSYGYNNYTVNANGQQDSGGGGRFCTFKNPDNDHCEIEFRAFNNSALDALRICAMFSGDQP